MPTPYILRPADTIQTEIVARFGDQANQQDLAELTSPSVSMLIAGAALAFCKRNELTGKSDLFDTIRILLNDEDFVRFEGDLQGATAWFKKEFNL